MRYLFVVLSFFVVTSAPCFAIIGGMPVTKLDARTQAMLDPVVKLDLNYPSLKTGGTCTGTLIARDVILTAAHCLNYFGVKVLERDITAIRFFQKKPSKWAKASIKAKRYIVDPMYKGENDSRDDLGLILLEREFTPAEADTADLVPADMTDFEFNGHGPFIIAGYGQTSDAYHAEASKTLMATPWVASSISNFSVWGSPLVDENYLRILLGEDLHFGICFGDSGGPLMGVVNNSPTIFGVTSAVKWAFATPELKAEYRDAGGDPKKVDAFLKRHPDFHQCDGSRDIFVDLIQKRAWILATIRELHKN